MVAVPANLGSNFAHLISHFLRLVLPFLSGRKIWFRW
uniref:Uncharacterized protein n=1 Tax=Arundo donax TaxID=35708 RepID=A0A0A8ZVX8_ARUDO